MLNKEDIERIIDEKIKAHEKRVGIISGIIGLIVFAGTFHAIYLNHLR